jgi:putative phosphoribosyl transferase
MPQMLQIEQLIEIPSAGIVGDLRRPAEATGLVIFAHGSGSSRLSSRNRFVADVLHQAGFATLLLDLLTEHEEQIDLRTRRLRFDIDLLAARLSDATKWSQEYRDTSHLDIGYFGASTGAAAALIAASHFHWAVRAVVSRGGRPDLAGSALPRVTAPTLLIVGGDDGPVIELNNQALEKLRCEKKLEIVPGATHLFEEPGTLERVAELASSWFNRHLSMKVSKKECYMSFTGLEVFDTTQQKTNEWLQQIMEEAGAASKQEAYAILRATLQTLRDRLPLEETAHLGAQLPMLIRGIYYEGWRPGLEVAKMHRQEFFDAVLARLARTALENSDPEPAVRAVFHALSRNLSPGEIQKIIHVLPGDLRDLWETAVTSSTRAQTA